MRRQLLLVPAILAALTLAACEKNDDTEIRARQAEFLAGPHIEMVQAIEIAVAEIPGSGAVRSELEVETDENEIHYKVYLLDENGESVEVEIDPYNGRVTEIEDAHGERPNDEKDP